MNTKANSWSVLVITVVLLLSACGTGRPRAGQWEGDDSDSYPSPSYSISFTVTADNKIVDFKFVCEWVNIYPLTANQLNIEDDGKFVAGDPFPLVRGQFTNPTEASGEYEGLFMCGSPNKTWKAQWVES
jgi:hypothetical protein